MSISRGKLLLICTIIIVSVVTLIVKVSKNDNIKNKNNTSELITVSEDGTKTNISTKLGETKLYNGLEITDISLTEKDGLAQVTAVVTNNIGMDIDGFPITLNAKDKKGNIIEKIGAYVGSIKVGESRMIIANINMDISNIYDIEVTQ